MTLFEGQDAVVTLTKGQRRWKTTAPVTSHSVNFNLDSILPSGKYRVEISVGGYIFPSDRDTYIEIEDSDKELVTEEVHALKELDIAKEVEKQLAVKTVTDGGVCPEFPDLLFFYNLGKVQKKMETTKLTEFARTLGEDNKRVNEELKTKVSTSAMTQAITQAVTQAKTEVKAEILGEGTPENLDTLKEIADKITNMGQDENGALLGKVTEVSGRVDQIANLDLVETYNQAKA